MENNIEVCMQIKICTKCKTEKTINEFRVNKNSCKKCEYEKQKARLSSPEAKDHRKEYLKKNWEENKARHNNLRKKKLIELKLNEEQYKKHLENKRQINNKSWAGRNGKTPDDIILNRELRKAQTLLNKELKKLYKNSTVKKGKIFYSEKYKDMRINNTQYKLKDNMRARIRKALKNQSTLKSKSTFELVGCTGAELTQHLLLLEYNKETDHVDHIVPLSRFDLTNPNHQLVVCHYLNLQPLHFFENCSKGDSLPDNWQEIIIQICEVRNIESDSVIQYIQSGVKC